MKYETTSSAEGEENGGTAVLRPQPVSDELISRLAGTCEAISPLKDRLARGSISDEEIQEMESLLRRLQPSQPRVLFREQCCALMCAESEREWETRLRMLSASAPLEFSVCKMARAMNEADDPEREEPLKRAPRRRFVSIAAISALAAAALVAGVLLVQNALVVPGEMDQDMNTASVSEKPDPSLDTGEKREHLREPTLFELQGGDERVPVMAPAEKPDILPEKEY